MLVMISFKSILSSSCLVTIVELPSSDEMEMLYTEHNFQVDFENLRVQLEISCRENTSHIVIGKLLIRKCTTKNNSIH